MDKNKKRPVYLDLLRIRLPITGVVSITHRITGVLLVVATPFALWALQASLRDASAFEALRAGLISAGGRILLWLLLWLFVLHFLSGVRHLLLDIDVGIRRETARASAWGVFVVSIVVVAAIGVAV